MGTQELGTPVLSGLFLTPEGFGQDDGGQLDDFHLLSFVSCGLHGANQLA